MSEADPFLYLLAIFLPPVAVFFKRGCSGEILLNLLLTCLGWIPGVLHAWYIIAHTRRRRVVVYAPERRHHNYHTRHYRRRY